MSGKRERELVEGEEEVEADRDKKGRESLVCCFDWHSGSEIFCNQNKKCSSSSETACLTKSED